MYVCQCTSKTEHRETTQVNPSLIHPFLLTAIITNHIAELRRMSCLKEERYRNGITWVAYSYRFKGHQLLRACRGETGYEAGLSMFCLACTRTLIYNLAFCGFGNAEIKELEKSGFWHFHPYTLYIFGKCFHTCLCIFFGCNVVK